MTPEQQLLDKTIRQLELVGAEVAKALQQAASGMVVAQGMLVRLRKTYGLDDDAEHTGRG